MGKFTGVAFLLSDEKTFFIFVRYIFYCSFDFCTSDESNSPVENLGQVVFGERIRPSPYNVRSYKLFYSESKPHI